MMMIENEHFNYMNVVSCKVTTIEHDDNRQLGGVGVFGALWGDRDIGSVRGVLGSWQGLWVLRGQKGYRGH